MSLFLIGSKLNSVWNQIVILLNNCGERDKLSQIEGCYKLQIHEAQLRNWGGGREQTADFPRLWHACSILYAAKMAPGYKMQVALRSRSLNLNYGHVSKGNRWLVQGLAEGLFWAVGSNYRMLRCLTNLSARPRRAKPAGLQVRLLPEQSHLTITFSMIEGQSSLCIWAINQILIAFFLATWELFLNCFNCWYVDHLLVMLSWWTATNANFPWQLETPLRLAGAC